MVVARTVTRPCSTPSAPARRALHLGTERSDARPLADQDAVGVDELEARLAHGGHRALEEEQATRRPPTPPRPRGRSCRCRRARPPRAPRRRARGRRRRRPSGRRARPRRGTRRPPTTSAAPSEKAWASTPIPTRRSLIRAAPGGPTRRVEDGDRLVARGAEVARAPRRSRGPTSWADVRVRGERRADTALAAAGEEARVRIELADRLAQARGRDLHGDPALGDGRGGVLVARLDGLGRGPAPEDLHEVGVREHVGEPAPRERRPGPRSSGARPPRRTVASQRPSAPCRPPRRRSGARTRAGSPTDRARGSRPARRRGPGAIRARARASPAGPRSLAATTASQ